MPSSAGDARKRARLTPDQRRDHLIRTAIAMFAEEGVAATSILRLTQAAGVSNGIFYHYFSNKQELEDAVALVVLGDHVARLAEVQRSGSYSARIAMGAVGTMRAIAANRELGAIMTQYLEQHHDAARRSSVQIDDDVRAGVEAGEFDINGPRQLVVDILVATLAVGARAVLAGAEPDDTGEEVAAAHLRVLGVSRRRADGIAARARAMSGLSHG
ncbi:TetR/AcrR family transcriptional regulator [Mycolicibacter arupensis]|uniref:TetR/AcrR family transcriptional regulator n=1 Tax=Mycolicibacter arupensis TaxID=342002 RepID=UPI00122C13C6|nr:TetR/AcrR family transcriptional regulator [Mycolicibacter arupensis]KAA1430297.1 TetR family transcriptional regulator [Mycolicibacter arupensis]